MFDFLKLLGAAPNESKRPARPPVLQGMNANGTERVVLRDSDNMQAIAARHNAEMIYGKANVPATFGMKPVIEVLGPSGEWEPVAGRSNNIPDMDTQIAYLNSFRENGQVGMMPAGQKADAIAGTGPMPAVSSPDYQIGKGAVQGAQGLPLPQMNAPQITAQVGMQQQAPMIVSGEVIKGGAEEKKQKKQESSQKPAAQPQGKTAQNAAAQPKLQFSLDTREAAAKAARDQKFMMVPLPMDGILLQ